MGAEMTTQDTEAAIAAFIRARGVTRCPTVCAVPTQASVGEADRRALQQRDQQIEARRTDRRMQQAALFRFGRVA